MEDRSAKLAQRSVMVYLHRQACFAADERAKLVHAKSFTYPKVYFAPPGGKADPVAAMDLSLRETSHPFYSSFNKLYPASLDYSRSRVGSLLSQSKGKIKPNKLYVDERLYAVDSYSFLSDESLEYCAEERTKLASRARDSGLEPDGLTLFRHGQLYCAGGAVTKTIGEAFSIRAHCMGRFFERAVHTIRSEKEDVDHLLTAVKPSLAASAVFLMSQLLRGASGAKHQDCFYAPSDSASGVWSMRIETPDPRNVPDGDPLRPLVFSDTYLLTHSGTPMFQNKVRALSIWQAQYGKYFSGKESQLFSYASKSHAMQHYGFSSFDYFACNDKPGSSVMTSAERLQRVAAFVHLVLEKLPTKTSVMSLAEKIENPDLFSAEDYNEMMVVCAIDELATIQASLATVFEAHDKRRAEYFRINAAKLENSTRPSSESSRPEKSLASDKKEKCPTPSF